MQKPTAIRNTTWAELKVGASSSIERSCSVQDLYLFAHVSGNTNPLMLPGKEGTVASTDPVAPSMWVGSLISAVLGNILPGPGTLYRAQSLRFHHRVHIGDKLHVTVTCREKGVEPFAIFDTRIEDSVGNLVCDGVAEIDAPRTTTITEAADLPELIIEHKDHFARLVAMAAQLPPLTTVVVCPEDKNSLGGAVLSAEKGLIRPIFVGDSARIQAAADELGANIGNWTIVPESGHRAAAARAVAMVRADEAAAIMKGAIHSDELLEAIVKKENGLRTLGRISHVFAMDVPSLNTLLFISDAAINIAPDLLAKVEIVQNAIDLARACGLEQPRVGILSAVETINPNIPSTIDAAVLAKMAERGQIRGGLVDGPLAMDNAIDVEAARTKGIASLVAGHANVLIVPNLEAGNMLAKELTFVTRAEAAGLVIGAKVPIMLTSRADNDRARLASCALALLYDFWRREGRSFKGRENSGLAAA